MSPGTLEVLIPSWHPKQGLVRWENKNKYNVLQLHHSADPDKDNDWAEAAAQKYPEGRSGKYWRAEMDIDWGAKSGELVYREFSRATHVIEWDMAEAFDDAPDWPRFVMVDPGYINPCGVLFGMLDPDGTRYILGEIYRRREDVPQISRRIKAMCARYWPYEMALIGRDAFSPSQVAAGETIADQYAKEGIFVNPADIKVEAGILSVAKGLMPRQNGEPGIKISSQCENLIWELENYRYEELDEDQKTKKAYKERPLKVNDHLCDCLRYFCMTIPDDYARRYGSGISSTPDRLVQIAHSNRLKKAESYRQMDRELEDPYDDLYDD